MRHIHIILLAVFLLASCTKENPEIADQLLPPKGMAAVTLGELRLSDTDAVFGADASVPATRAATSNLPAGSRVRLYAFKQGETDFYNKLLTRTYTINASGTAVLDPEQEPLYLPTGEVAIYLAGPLARNIGTDAIPVWTDVAGELGIYPYQGVDLIATYILATIKSGRVNPLPPLTLVHKMAKVQVVVSRHPRGAYENLVVKGVELYAQSQTGTYTLDATGGAIIPDATFNFSYPEIIAETLHEKYSGTALLIPQPEKNLLIEVTFECNQIGTDGKTHPTVAYLQSGLISTALAAGTATRFSALPLTPVEIKWRVTVQPWNVVDQTPIYVPGLEVLPPVTAGLVGCYDGHYPPVIINNVLVWRDHSPQQNHGKLLDGTTWDSASSSYIGPIDLINENASYLYSAQNGMTVEMIWKRPSVFGDAIVFRIGKTGEPQSYLRNWDPAGNKYSHWNEEGFDKRYLWGESTEAQDVYNFSSWVWAKGGHEKSSGYYNQGYKNGIPQTTQSATTKTSLMGKNYITFGYSAWRMQAVRIYNRQLTDVEIKQNYDFDKQYYGLQY